MTLYISVLDADNYLKTQLGTEEWFAVNYEKRTAALTTAQNTIDQLSFVGSKTDTTQENEFPRDGNTVVPTAIKEAVCEEALMLLRGYNPEDEYRNLVTISEGISTTRQTTDVFAVRQHLSAGIVSFKAWRKLLPYLKANTDLTISRA